MVNGDIVSVHFTITEDTYNSGNISKQLIKNLTNGANYSSIGVDVLNDTGSSGITKNRIVLSLIDAT